MKKYVLYKDNKYNKINVIKLEDGFCFHKDNKIVVYDCDLIKNLIIYKLNNKLKLIIKHYLENEDDSDSSEELKLDIEELRMLLSNIYAKYLDKKTYLEYLNKFNKLENKFVKYTKKRKTK